MEFIKNLLINNWSLLVSVVIFILSFILQLIKKKPVNGLIYDITSFALFAVIQAEGSGYKGEEKLRYAIQQVQIMLLSKYPDLDVGNYISIITDTIEFILETPQKKGDKSDGK